jgi:hypothetical protein
MYIPRTRLLSLLISKTFQNFQKSYTLLKTETTLNKKQK